MKLKSFSKYSSKITQSFLKNHWVRHLLIPTVLLLIGLLFSGFNSLTYNASFTVLPYEHKNNYAITPASGRLLAGEEITGEFKAKENNLGAVAIRLHNFNSGSRALDGNRAEEDEIIFRLKEKGKKDWYYEQQYSGGQFHELVHFPFGFQPIHDSQNKQYYFEIYSKRGGKDNALTITNQEPLIITNYQFNKNTLLTNNNELISFLFQKFLYTFSHTDFYFTVFIFLLPFILYIIWITFLEKTLTILLRYFIKKIQNFTSHIIRYTQFAQFLEGISIFEVLIFFGFMVDILFIRYNNSLITITLLSMWFFIVLLHHFKSRASFILALIFLSLCPLLFIFPESIMAEKAVIWTILLLIFGAIQSVLEVNYSKA